jgi:hypothetical protein
MKRFERNGPVSRRKHANFDRLALKPQVRIRSCSNQCSPLPKTQG